MRTRVAFEHSTQYGPLGYLDPNNLKTNMNHEEFIDTIEKYKDREKNNIVIKHHKNKYNGDIPFWAMIEFFSFSELSKFYKNMITHNKKNISKNYGQYYTLIESWLYCLSFLRNSCAHYSRLYYSKMIPLPKTPNAFPITLGRTIFDYFIILKLLLVKNDIFTDEIFPRLDQLIISYANDIEIGHIGFPQDWRKYLK
jgi:abortive infection bacteriophage resistance protein